MDARFDELDSSLQSLREREGKVSANLVAEFRKRFEISVIYHDSALEGVVLSYSEIKAAIDKNIISDVSLIPSYQEIKNFKDAVDYAREAAEDRKKPIGIETIRKIYGILTPEEVAKGLPYRKDNPLHRHYYHEISTPDKIPARMKILQTWLEEDSTRRMHPVDRAARAQFKLMSIYPWTKNSGRVARIFAHALLFSGGYPLAIVHSIDRQRYYEALRAEQLGIVNLYAEAVATGIETALKFYEETTATAARRRAS